MVYQTKIRWIEDNRYP